MSKDDLIGGLVLFNGRLCTVIGHNNGLFSYILEECEPRLCNSCGAQQSKEQFNVIESSRQWADDVQPVKTLHRPTTKEEKESV